MSSYLNINNSWVIWSCKALLEDIDKDHILDTLIKNGASPKEATELLQILAQSPFLEAARSGANRARRESQSLRNQLYSIASKFVHQEIPTPETFHNVYLAHGVPVHIPGFCARSSALQNWNPQRLNQLIGNFKVEVCKGRLSDKTPDRNFRRYCHKMTMSKYIKEVEASHGNDLYMIARNNNFSLFAQHLWDDLTFPEGFFCPERAKQFTSFWYGPKFTHTKTHHDTTNILFCQIRGEKTFWLSPPENIELATQADSYYARKQLSELEQTQSVLTHIFKATLSPGDALLIPVGWWHEVLSLSTSISLGITGLLFENRYVDYHPAPLKNS